MAERQEDTKSLEPAAGDGHRPAGRRAPARLTIPRRLAGRGRPATLAAIAAGGALGAPARYLLGKAVYVSPGTFPWGTFWINVSGSFALGVLLTLVVERWPPTRFARPFAAVGFLGAYTTFSTFGVEADRLISAGRMAIAAAYVAGSVVGGLAAVYLGISLTRLWPGGERR
ncbi:MAG: fluoride efflux transporter CrcB [Actinobacteria bacterium]|nr:fluoride efflux transporter CrcB [Actinomycetota bacterium]